MKSRANANNIAQSPAQEDAALRHRAAHSKARARAHVTSIAPHRAHLARIQRRSLKRTGYLLDSNVLMHVANMAEGHERILEKLTVLASRCCISAHAREVDYVCVTNNVSEYRRLSGLVIENWRTEG